MGKDGKLTRLEISRHRADIWNSEERKKANKPTDDTIERKDINSDIIKMISEGKGKIEIMTTLTNKYPNSKLAKYFERWYEHHKEKQNDKKTYIDYR